MNKQWHPKDLISLSVRKISALKQKILIIKRKNNQNKNRKTARRINGPKLRSKAMNNLNHQWRIWKRKMTYLLYLHIIIPLSLDKWASTSIMIINNYLTQMIKCSKDMMCIIACVITIWVIWTSTRSLIMLLC
jgi:hypothetical protein